MRTYRLAFLLAALVVLTGATLRRTAGQVGGAPISSTTSIGGSPVPFPPSAAHSR